MTTSQFLSIIIEIIAVAVIGTALAAVIVGFIKK